MRIQHKINLIRLSLEISRSAKVLSVFFFLTILTQPVEAMQYPYHPLEEATYHFNTDPSLSHKLVEDLIWEDMEDDLITSVLVDVLREKDKEEEDDDDAYVSDLVGSSCFSVVD